MFPEQTLNVVCVTGSIVAILVRDGPKNSTEIHRALFHLSTREVAEGLAMLVQARVVAEDRGVFSNQINFR